MQAELARVRAAVAEGLRHRDMKALMVQARLAAVRGHA
ncbi:Uncharacterised protein [Bordetella pertussis]|nr:Uncharacterised protein [Bordetella pertussis]